MGKHYHQTVIPISHEALEDKQDNQEYIVESKVIVTHGQPN